MEKVLIVYAGETPLQLEMGTGGSLHLKPGTVATLTEEELGYVSTHHRSVMPMLQEVGRIGTKPEAPCNPTPIVLEEPRSPTVVPRKVTKTKPRSRKG